MIIPVRYPDSPEGELIGQLEVSIKEGQWWYKPVYMGPQEPIPVPLGPAPSEAAARLLIETVFHGVESRQALKALVQCLRTEQFFLHETTALWIGDANYDRLQARAETVDDLYRHLEYLDL
jgi:hypothetical protein